MTHQSSPAESEKLKTKFISAFRFPLSALAAACGIALAPDGVSVASDATNMVAATVHDAGTNASHLTTPAEINIALRNSANLVTSSNLLDAGEQVRLTPRQDFQLQLEQGWQQKRNKDNAGAEKTFVALLESAAPSEFQRPSGARSLFIRVPVVHTTG